MKKFILFLLLSGFAFVVLLTGGQLALQQQQAVDCGIPIGSLPDKVPEPLNGIATEAGKRFGVDPMAPILVYYAENYQSPGVFREPAPPYGDGPPWPTSYAFAVGPMQFLPSTWFGYMYANPAHQPGDIMDLKDAIYGATAYLKDLGAKPHMAFGDPDNALAHPGTIAFVMARYNGSSHLTGYLPQSRAYVNRAYQEYKRLTGRGKATPGKGNAPKISHDPSKVCVDPGASGKAKTVIKFAEKQLDDQYVLGAEGPNYWDCSGLTLRSFQRAGINLPRTAAAQWQATKKWQVPASQAQPGDLVFFRTVGSNEAPGHVGIIVNAKKHTMINALKPGSVVRYDSYDWSDRIGITHPYPTDKAKKHK